MDGRMNLQPFFHDAQMRGVDTSGIGLLPPAASQVIWDQWLEHGPRHYFELTSACWLTSADWTFLGDWCRVFENEGINGLASLLSEVRGFESGVYFCKHRHAIASAPWAVFCQAVDGFLEWHDDAPVVLNGTGDRALRFGTLGRLCLAVRQER